MTLLTLDQAAQWIDGASVVGAGTTPFARVSTDSRTAGPGDLFVALRGERFDAHAFLAAVAAQGVAAAIVSQDIAPDTLRDAAGRSLPHLRVPDTRLALGALARGWRRRFDLPVVAVTGSNGKTTVKEMIASIFAAAVGEAARLATRGNLNNDIGVPLTLLRLTPAHALAVIELGMNHPDETRYLAELTEPTIALVNNAQREHQEFMRTVEAVALEHASVIHALGASGVAVYPADDRYAPIWRVAAHQRRVLDFMLDEGHAGADAPRAAVTGTPGPEDDGALDIATPAGNFAVRLSTQGRHNLRNALAATAAALAANVPIEAIRAGLEAFAPVKGRLQLKRATFAPFAGARLIDDTYNANPDSMRAAIDVLAAAPSPRVLIVGDMGEVGDQEAAAHREIGAYAYASGIDAFYALGDASRGACQAFGTHARHFASVAELIDGLRTSDLGADATLLVKGSRFMAMERVVDALLDVATTPH
ncbi:UDP-N-acetylmuramoyl-tripeptide--D-alanyl-D-alanine ligase [Robbsia sp. Bb-Pol-6]|uniref:UDP-N-acetylmuramoyl-tripeptide--D-alanyl-D-alanine ligase n=1 Tax=Robbsia betulipollinis TaxID=2981849 RepID=A0ABT3ZRW0_9BURK|nr:UDP-N-acetylmuramoyl-tripeptide--D-alanyl-D-alanine ligase [Robbsia betulipollinis]MCY0388950.1 UDP-N-acetylmuramoyl-tripeptide--D-alanyl-D-alanine ligase [Robbsia betulipollinis]